MAVKRDWITRMVDIFYKLKLNVLYNVTNVRDFLRDKCNDSISLPTTGDLLASISYAQEKGLIFEVGGKVRKLIEKKTVSGETRYELIEINHDV